MTTQPCTSAAPHRSDWWYGTAEFRLVRYRASGQLVWQRLGSLCWVDWTSYHPNRPPSTTERDLRLPLGAMLDGFDVVD